MLCLLVGKPSTYFTVSPVTGAGVTHRYWIPVAGALWLGRPFPCLAFLWSPRGCSPPPSVHAAGGTAWGEICLANSRVLSGKRQPHLLPASLLASVRIPASSSPRGLPPGMRNLFAHPEKVFPFLRGMCIAFFGNPWTRQLSPVFN